MSTSSFSVLFAVLASSAPSAAGGFIPPEDLCVTTKARLFDPNGALSDGFGSAVALSGTTLIVGSPRDDEGATDSGSAFVFELVGGEWVQQEKLLPADAFVEGKFGAAVDVDGDRAVIGAPIADGNAPRSGAVYVFERTAGVWGPGTKIVAEDGGLNDDFGFSVSIEGDRILVGAERDDDLGEDSGAAYVFRYETGSWVLEQKIFADDHAALWKLGRSVALSGDKALVGAWGASGAVPGAGAAYVFERSGTTWAQEQKLVGAAGFFDFFGWVVDLSGDRAIVGTALGNIRHALVFAYDGSAWQLEASLQGVGFADYGETVAIEGDVALVGAANESSLGFAAGRAYVYARDGAGAWSIASEIESTEVEARAGTALAVDGDTVVVGVASGDGADTDTGAVSIHALREHVTPAVAFRNAGTNPVSFGATAAAVGETIRFTVFPGSTGHDQALVFGFDGPTELVLSGGQTLLAIDIGSGTLVDTGFHPGPIAQIELAVPDLPTLAGLQLSTQAIHAFGAAPIALSNAQDLVIGGCPE